MKLHKIKKIEKTKIKYNLDDYTDNYKEDFDYYIEQTDYLLESYDESRENANENAKKYLYLSGILYVVHFFLNKLYDQSLDKIIDYFDTASVFLSTLGSISSLIYTGKTIYYEKKHKDTKQIQLSIDAEYGKYMGEVKRNEKI